MSDIFVLNEQRKLVPLSARPYESEDLLQALLAEYPSLMAGNQMRPDAPRRWMLVKREAGVPGEENGGGRWSLDHLFLDQDGVPTLVEVKRSTDTRIRREVVGQMLDYAANGVKYWPIDKLKASFERTCELSGTDPDARVRELIGPEGHAADFWITVKTNLQAGRIRMLFVADEIPDELRRVVEFLNEQMDPAEVLAIEIKQFTGGSLTTLVPRLIGQTIEAEDRKRVSSNRERRQWDESTYFAEMLSRQGPEIMGVARRLLDWSRPQVTRIFWGQGLVNGSFIPLLERNGEKHFVFTVYTGNPGGRAVVELNFQYWCQKAPFDDRNRRFELLTRINRISGVSIPEESLEKRPSIPLDRLSNVQSLQVFLGAMQGYVDEVKRT
jgi:hypothetical protein